MNYYPFHIGDYARDTRHLTMLEHGAYRLLIDLYYLRESPLPLGLQDVCRLACARSDDEILAVKTVLQEFFVGHPDGWRHVRCDEEIAKTKEKADKAKASATVRWSKDANAMRTHSERNAKAMLPIANSQEPIAKRKEKERESATDAADAALRSRAIAIPADFPTDADLAWCDTERPELSAGTVAVAFRDYHLAHGSTMKSWPAAWRTWVRKERAPIRVAPAYGKTALDKQADVIAKILRIDTAQPLDIFDEQPRLSAARD